MRITLVASASLLSLCLLPAAALACGPYHCENSWSLIQGEIQKSKAYSMTLPEVLQGSLRQEGLLLTYFPGEAATWSSTRRDSAERLVRVGDRLKTLKPIYDRYRIALKELPESSRHPEWYAESPEKTLDLARGLRDEKVDPAVAKRLLVLREWVQSEHPGESTTVTVPGAWDRSITELKSLAPTQPFAAYLLAASSLRYRYPSRPDLPAFEALRDSSSPWVREHALLSLIRVRIESLAETAEKLDPGAPVPASPEAERVRADIARFEKDFPKSPLLGSAQRYRIALALYSGDPQGCFDTMASLAQGYLEAKDFESFAQVHVGYTVEHCTPRQVPWDKPFIATLTPLPRTESLNTELSRLEAANPAYASHPELWTYQKTRLLVALGKPEEALAASKELIKPGTPLHVATRVLRVRALMALKRYPEAAAETVLAAAQRPHPGALRLLSYRAWIAAGDYVSLARDPLLKHSDFLAWILTQHADDGQLTGMLSRYAEIPARMRGVVFTVSVRRFLPRKEYAPFEKLIGQEKLLATTEHRQVLAAIRALSSDKAKAHDFFQAGDYLRRVIAGAPFLALDCFKESTDVPGAPGLARTTEEDAPAPSVSKTTPYDFYKEALARLKREERDHEEPLILHRLVSCYRSSNAWYPCEPASTPQHPNNDPLSRRREWFHRLKTTYRATAEAKSLEHFW